MRLSRWFIPLGCDVDNKENLALVGAEVNILPACILQKRSRQNSLVRLYAKSNTAASIQVNKIQRSS
jgi:hypothetical protein